ncbi:MAG: DUF5667 domain-containing protein [Actinomycetota bacterium]|nr:DUF5667 domain-containing protein [Actinomycetota bacterium]
MTATAERHRIDRFANQLDGRAVAVAPDLADLLGVAGALCRVPVNGDIDAQFRARLRARLVAVATVRPLAVAPVRPVPVAGPGAVAAKPATLRWRPRRTGLIAAALAAVVGAGAVAAASTNAVPGSTLYGLKRATESARLELAGGSVARGTLELKFARQRLSEARQVHTDPGRVRTALAAMDDQTRQGARLLTVAAATEQDRTPLDTIDRFVRRQGTGLASLLPTLPDASSHARAVNSLVLVEALRARSVALRANLLCTDGSGPLDVLGAVPMRCDRRAGTRSGGGSGGGPGGSTPGAAGTGTGSAGANSAQPSPNSQPPAGGSAGPGGTGAGGGSGGSAGGPSGTTTVPPVTPPGATGGTGTLTSTVTGAVAGVVGQILGTINGLLNPSPQPSPPALPLPLPSVLPSLLPTALPSLPPLPGTG